MSHGAHRAPKPKTRRLRRIAAGLSLAAAAATGAFLADDLIATPQGDTAWGAPDIDSTTTVTVDGTAGITADTSTTITPLDTAWG